MLQWLDQDWVSLVVHEVSVPGALRLVLPHSEMVVVILIVWSQEMQAAIRALVCVQLKLSGCGGS